jgi:hypothetical protein
MSTEAEQYTGTLAESTATEVAPAVSSAAVPPTTPCSVVWSGGRAFVLEEAAVRPRWVGTDNRGRPQWLTCADLQRRGWSHRRAG